MLQKCWCSGTSLSHFLCNTASNNVSLTTDVLQRVGLSVVFIILTVLGVDLEGKKEVLARRSCAEEDKEGWLSVLQDMRTRGATQVDLLVTDGHDGLLAAVGELFSA